MSDKNLDLDCLIVLGARLNQEGRPGRIARLRMEHALHLWRAGGATCRLLLTGGCSREGLAVSEARAMADYALERAEKFWGPDFQERLEACLLLEEASRTTWDSARHTLPLVRDGNFGAVGLVSDSLHLRRAHYLFRRHYRGHPVLLQPLPVPGVFRHYWQHRRYLWLTKMVLRESGAWLKVLAPWPRPRKKK
jgi:uncharacterized SAM-binding protein YcdF (DUF218 family)